MKRVTAAIILASVAALLLAGVTYYYLQRNPAQLSATLKVSYSVIEDLEILSTARKLIEAQLPVLAKFGVKLSVDWLSVDIAVLKVTVELTNNDVQPVYYETNHYCGVELVNSTELEPLSWKVDFPVAKLEVIVEEGEKFSLLVFCTADLTYRILQPGASTAREYYYIVTKPFKGVVKATATVCTSLMGSECRVLESIVEVVVQ